MDIIEKRYFQSACSGKIVGPYLSNTSEYNWYNSNTRLWIKLL